jgi:uncharacterized MnhB-related membrane protein
MFKIIIATCFAHIVAVYLCGMYSDLAEGWKQPRKALLAGSVGSLLLVIPQLLMMAPSSFGHPMPTDTSIIIGTVLSTIWYILALNKLYEFRLGTIIAVIAFTRQFTLGIMMKLM